jgi:glycosyltransferase involved in cell wall biosynthesis
MCFSLLFRGVNMSFKVSDVYDVSLELLDPQPRPDYLRLLAGARYAVNPSRQEVYSIFAAEALAMGVPTITTP